MGDRDMQLGGRQRQRFSSYILGNALHFVEHFAWLHERDPIFDAALTFTLANLKRLFGDRLVGKNSDPDLSTTTNTACHSSTPCLYLARR